MELPVPLLNSRLAELGFVATFFVFGFGNWTADLCSNRWLKAQGLGPPPDTSDSKLSWSIPLFHLLEIGV